MEEKLKIPKIRTAKEVVLELKELDPKTAITEYFIRQEVKRDLEEKFSFKSGSKYLINLEKFIEHLNNPGTASIDKKMSNKYGIKPVD